MTQRYAGVLRRQARDWDKRDMPVQAGCARQAALHLEELQAEIERLRRDLAQAEGLASAAMRSAFPAIAAAHPVPDGTYSSDHRQ